MKFLQLPAIPGPADPEDCVVSDRRANALTKDHLAMPIHVHRQAGLDKGGRSWQVKTSLLCGYLTKVARQSVRTASTVRAPGCVPAFDEELYQCQG